MNILNKFVSRSLKLNKKRTIVTIIGIALSTALITATVGLVSSFQNTLLKDAIKGSGDYHAEFIDVSQKDKNNLANNENIKNYMCTQEIGFAKLDGTKNEYKPYVCLKEYDDMAMKNLSLRLTEGRLPQNSNEIVISKHIISNGGVKYKIGDKISLKIGDRVFEGEKLSNQIPLKQKEGTDVIQEQLEFKFQKEYTIVGIIERLNFGQEDYSAPGYTIISKLENEAPNVNMFVKYKNVSKAYKITEEINTDLKYGVKYNSDVLRYSGVAKNAEMNAMLYAVGGIVIGIIVFSSVFVIRNSFSISVTEKYKQYGMLTSIGATSKQIKKNVLYEGFLLGIIAIPLGIFFAAIAVFVLCWLLNVILGEFLNDIVFSFSMPLWAIAIGVLMSGITIYLSCILPARKASKISPIDAIRSNQDINIKKKKLKISPLFKKMFNIGGQISLKNLKRNKKKYRTTVISLVVSIIIFISLSSILKYGFNMGNTYYEQLGYNIEVHTSEENKIEKYNKILQLDNIKAYSYFKNISLFIDQEKYSNNLSSSTNISEEDLLISIITLQADEYKKLIKEVGGKEADYKDKGILIDNYEYYNGEKRKTGNYLSVNEGDTIITKDNKEIKIAKRTNYRPMGMESMYGNGMIIVSEELFNKIVDEDKYTISSLCIDSNKPDKLETELKKMLNTDLDVVNYNEYVKSNKAIMLIISIFLYGFITVITLIGVTNIFNTITTNMALRSKEFAMLKSIGMTTKEFNKMIRLESILYGTKSLLIGLPIGLLLSYVIYNIINSTQEMAYSFPFTQILICIAFVFIIVALTMKYSLNKINNQNIIETIRNDNI